MLVATAGHVDHGKTTLVQRLTGVDTDRLPEEKQRGVSIDLGFAYSDLDGQARIGFIDVPGHEKFVRNMLAGVGSIDLAMLVVAADDGPMPQTREHLAILDLLGVKTGVIVLTRTDLVDATRKQTAIDQCNALVANTAFANAPVFAVSAVTGDGIDALRAYLTDQASQAAEHNTAGKFRLAVDRQFNVPGSGLVVTGTVFSGALDQDQSVILMPANKSVRVRGLRVQDQSATRTMAGDRCALNLNASDLGRTEIVRGDWLTEAPAGQTTQRIDVSLSLLGSEKKPLKHWSPVHLHWAAGSSTGRVALLQGQVLAPGESALAQLVLDEPWMVCTGDRLVVRDQSAQRTVAGATVLDPFGPARGRAQPARLAALTAIQSVTADNAVAAMLQISEDGIDPMRVGQMFNLSASQLQAQLDQTNAVPVVIDAGTARASTRYANKAQWSVICEAVNSILGEVHREQPDVLGLVQHELISRLRAQCETTRVMANAAINEQISNAAVKRNGQFLHLTDHRPVLSEALERQWAPIAPHLSATTLQPPVVSDLAKILEMEKPALQTVLFEAADRGLISRFAPNRFFHPEAITRLAHIVETLGQDYPDGFDARQFKDAASIGRNLSIELLEYFDTQRLTRRIGDKRIVVGNSTALFGAL